MSLMRSVCKAPSSISLMTTFTRAADNLPIVQPGYWNSFSRAEGFKVSLREQSQSLAVLSSD